MTYEPPRDWSFVPPGATGPRILIRRQWGLRPIVTADGVPLRPKWNFRTSGMFAYLVLLIVMTMLVSTSEQTLGVVVPIAVGFFLVELPWLGTYSVPLADGTTGEMRLKGARRGIRAAIAGAEIPAEPQLSTLAVVLSVLPWLALLAVLWIRVAPFGGPNLLGSFEPIVTSVLGILAFAGSQAIVRSTARPGTQALAAVALTLLVAGVELGLHYGRPAVPVLAAGDCLDLGRGDSLRTTTPTVACTASHTSEVIGAPVLDVAYPGAVPLSLMASERCNALFLDYVGSDPERSALVVGYFAPARELWDLGARTINCIAYRRDGSQLSRSVRGTGL